MPEYLTPGVYVEEFEIGAKPIEGVSTSTVGFLGETERGPTRPKFVSSWPDFQRNFGSFFGANKYLPYAVQGFFLNGGKQCYVARIVDKEGAKLAQISLGSIIVQAIGPGLWGKRVAIKVDEGSTEGFKLRVYYWREVPAELFDPALAENARKTPQPSKSEEFDDLVLDENSPNYFDKRVNNGLSSLIELVLVGDENEVPGEQDIQFLDGGEDGDLVNLSVFDFEGVAEVGKRTGLNAFNEPEYRDIAIIYAPNAYDINSLADRLMSHCENNKYRFAILDAKKGEKNITSIKPRTERPSKYSAFYYPWIKILDADTNARKVVPPGGHVAGIYARSDIERGVFKAPANEVVRGALEMEFPISNKEQANLNPRGINVIRTFPGRGRRVWGARTLSADPLWKYVNVRRLFIFIEASIYRGTQWVVFEPNNERLWARVRQTIEQFLRTQWRAGA